MKKILVTGSDGQLGFALRRIANDNPDLNFIFFNRHQWDITHKESSREIFRWHKPDVLINTAAYTAVDKAESDVDQCNAVNYHAAEQLAHFCLDWNTLMVQISTDYVFNREGNQNLIKEYESKNPRGIYAVSKSKAEDSIMGLLEKYIIIRSSWLYGPHGHNFVKTILKLAETKDELRVVNDQTGSPTYVGDLADAIVKLVLTHDEKPAAYGIFHYANQGLCTWYELAGQVLDYFKLNVKLHPISTAEFGAPAPRPHFSGLNCERIKAIYGIEIPLWKESLHKCLKQLNPAT